MLLIQGLLRLRISILWIKLKVYKLNQFLKLMLSKELVELVGFDQENVSDFILNGHFRMKWRTFQLQRFKEVI